MKNHEYQLAKKVWKPHRQLRQKRNRISNLFTKFYDVISHTKTLQVALRLVLLIVWKDLEMWFDRERVLGLFNLFNDVARRITGPINYKNIQLHSSRIETSTIYISVSLVERPLKQQRL